jgi:hypothetical protein
MSDDVSEPLAWLVEIAIGALREDEGLVADAMTATGSGAKLAAILSREHGVPLEDCEIIVLAAVQRLHDEGSDDAMG